MDSAQKVKYLIENNEHMTIASSNASGKPWISPVSFMYDDNYHFYWVSSKDALHSQNVRNRPQVAIVIYGPLPNGDIDGVYIDANAIELEDEANIKLGMETMARRPQSSKFTIKSVLDVSGDALWRIYKATPTQISKRADEVKNGQAITVRELVNLNT